MKIQVEQAKCSGHAQCYMTAPELYEIDDDGYSTITDKNVPRDLEDAAVKGAGACPERAISIDP